MHFEGAEQFSVPPDLPLKSYNIMHYVPEPIGVIEKTPIDFSGL